jgi:hypothetical protein
VQVLCLVVLTDMAAADKIPDELVVVRREECSVKTVEGLLDTLVAHANGPTRPPPAIARMTVAGRCGCHRR